MQNDRASLLRSKRHEGCDVIRNLNVSHATPQCSQSVHTIPSRPALVNHKEIEQSKRSNYMKLVYILSTIALGLLMVIKVYPSNQDRQARTAHPCLQGRLVSDPGAAAPASTQGIAALNTAVRATMHDRRSFDPTVTQIFPAGQAVGGHRPGTFNHIAAIRFRGRNALGATVTNEVIAEINPTTCSVVRLFD